MAWRIELSETARKELGKLDKSVANRINKFLRDRVAQLENPRSIGQALKGERFGTLWKYRVGDYRVIAEIQDERILILILSIGHRREIYR